MNSNKSKSNSHSNSKRNSSSNNKINSNSNSNSSSSTATKAATETATVPLEMSEHEFAGARSVTPPPPHFPYAQTTTKRSSSCLSGKELALQEAAQVLEASRQQLESFNLLGVVANPRGPHDNRMHYLSQHQSGSSSSNNRRASNNHSYATANHATGPSTSASTTATASSSSLPVTTTSDHGSGLEDTILALESTLAGVTGHIDAINHVVDVWSRTYLGRYYYEALNDYTEYAPPTEVPMGQLTELPLELSSLTLASVQDYLNDAGVLAHAFDERGIRNRREQQEQTNAEWHEGIAPDSSVRDLVESNDDEFMLDLEERIPARFFETYFDLTDANAFSELLVLEPGQDVSDYDSFGGHASSSSGRQQQQAQAQPAPPAISPITDGSNDMAQLPDCLKVPTQSILRLPPPDAFTGFLDKVELALLQQVRSKSIAFFHETNRFGQLKEWITGLVEEVQRVRTLLAQVQQKSVVEWELIPMLDSQRHDLDLLQSVLEGANDVITCKGSISGLLSADDDLGAAEQIQLARQLLQDDVLHKLMALQTVHDQLMQYENLVVANIGEELVEILLDWKSFVKTTAFPRIKNMVRGLQLCQSLDQVSQLYASRLLDIIRMTVRTTVGEFAEEADSSVKACVTSMTLERFADGCLDMLFEQLLDILQSAVGVQEFGTQEGVDFFSGAALTAAAELSSKSISELLRLRKEAHSLVNLDEMRRLWDVCITFTLELEKLSDYKATALRSTLLAQAKAFVERRHESNMSSLVAALDSERWTQCDVSAERQAALTRLCSGRSVTSAKLLRDSPAGASTEITKSPTALVEGVKYKVIWSCLLLVEMVMNNIACAAHFQSLATNVVGKVAELLRLFNSRSTQLVLGAGAIHSAARLKSINAKHLSLVTQCLGMTIAILPHVRAALMAQLPSKQHGLLQDLDRIKKEYNDHNEKVLNKFVNIIGGIVEHSLAPRIPGTNFDARAGEDGCCVFLDDIATNTRKMHQVLSSLLPPDHLQDVFSRILAWLDQKTPDLFVAASTPNSNNQGAFYFPTTDPGKRQMLVEVEKMTTNLNKLPGVRPWEFSAIRVLERKLEYELHPPALAPDADVVFAVAEPTPEAGTESEGEAVSEVEAAAPGEENTTSREPEPVEAFEPASEGEFETIGEENVLPEELIPGGVPEAGSEPVAPEVPMSNGNGAVHTNEEETLPMNGNDPTTPPQAEKGGPPQDEDDADEKQIATEDENSPKEKEQPDVAPEEPPEVTAPPLEDEQLPNRESDSTAAEVLVANGEKFLE